MYQLYIGNKNYSSWSLRPWILMKSLGIAFDEKLYIFGASDFRDFSPSGRVPCLVDGGIAVWDSLAIVEYLGENHRGVWPDDAAARAWARSASAEMHSGFADLRTLCGMNCGVRVTLHEQPDSLRRDIARIAELWAQGRKRFGGPFLAGSSFTAVDAFFAPVAFRAQTYGLDFGADGNAYIRMILDLPAMRDWYEAGVAEAFRDEPHEEEIRGYGSITEDVRATA